MLSSLLLPPRPAGNLFAGAAPMDTPIEPDADQAREWARDELSKRAYDEAKPGLLDRFWERVGKWLNELFEDAEGLGAGPGVLVLVLAAVVLVAVAVLIIRPRLNASVKKRAEVFADDLVERAADHRARAEQAAAELRWNDAVAERFRAMVRSAEERVIFDTRPARTAAEAGTRLAAAFPDYRRQIMELRQRFDEVLYGKGVAADADYLRAAALDTALESAVPSAAETDEPILAVPK